MAPGSQTAESTVSAASAAASAAAPPEVGRVVVERPPPGLARGDIAWPAWAIAVTGATVVLFGVAFLVWRFRRLRRT